MKGLNIISIFLVAIFIIGCKDNQEVNCRFEVQKAIDKGEFNTAINKLENECRASFSSSDLNYNLATAYMGAAGYSVSDVVSIVANSNQNTNAFASLLNGASKNTKSYSIEYLTKAKTYYLKSISQDTNASLSSICADPNLNSLPRVSNVCLYGSLLLVSKLTSTVSLLSDDITSVVDALNNNGSMPDSMKASIDALAWATNQPSLPYDSNITDSNVTINGVTYKHLVVDANNSGNIFYRLADNIPSSTIITDGYCDENGSKSNCLGIEKSDGSIDTSNANASKCYACPVVINNSGVLVSETLVNSIVESVDAISGLVGSNNADLKSSIDEFKQELDANNSDGNITIEDIITYLNK